MKDVIIFLAAEAAEENKRKGGAILFVICLIGVVAFLLRGKD